MVIHWGYTEELLTGLNPYSVMHRLTRELDSALLHVRISPIHAPPPGPTAPALDVQRNAATGSGDGLLRLLEALAAETGRSELKSAPLLFWDGRQRAGSDRPSQGSTPTESLASFSTRVTDEGFRPTGLPLALSLP